MNPQDNQPASTETAFKEAELKGLKLALIGRTLALLLLSIWFVSTRSGDLERALEYAAMFLAFIAIGGLHYWLVGSHYDRPWLKFIMMSVDVIALSVIVATQPVYDSIDVPQAITFRNNAFPFYFLFLGVAAITFSARLVLWTGFLGAAGWLSAFEWAVKDMAVRYDWDDIGWQPTTEQFYQYFLSPYFASSGSRAQEAAAYIVVAVLIAFVMHRARGIVRIQLALSRQKRQLSEMFGRYVPAPVVDALIQDQGMLAPVEREATVLFADIAEFTRMTETLGARRLVAVLNAYFEGATQIITRHDGIITQFQGDAILALFNVPVESPRHAEQALLAARELQAFVSDNLFAGERLAIRIGISSGPVVAGNVGGGGRQSYTAHGNTVNMAARLESLNKEYGTSLLMDGATADQCPGNGMRQIDRITVRGLSGPVELKGI